MIKECKNCLYAVPDFRNPKDSVDVLCNKARKRQRGYMFVRGDFVNPTCRDFIPKDIVSENKNLKEENAKLKRLLKQAVEDFEIIKNEMNCSNCDSDFDCCYCPLNTDNGNFSSKGWKHADEAMKLIGGDENER